MATRFRLVSCAAVLVLSHPAIAAEDAIQQPQLILLHQLPRSNTEISPEKARELALAADRVHARLMYGQFFAELQLTESQIDTLTKLIAEPGKESQIESFLGPASFQKFKEYQATLTERFQLNRLVRLLIAVGHPLTSEQSSQLVSIMRAERGERQELWPNSDEYDLRIKPRFAAVLSTEQREHAERYFVGRAERRHKPLSSYSSSPD